MQRQKMAWINTHNRPDLSGLAIEQKRSTTVQASASQGNEITLVYALVST